MTPKSAHILFAFLSLLAVAVPILAASRGPLLGGWRPISKPNAVKEVVDAAKFAVEDYNKKQNKSLVFVSVVKAGSQVVAGTKYMLTISAKDGKATGAAAAPSNYKAVVWYKVVGKTLELISFQKQLKG